MVENPIKRIVERIAKERKIRRLLPNEFLQRAFNNLTTETAFAEEATERKRNWILEIRERKLIDPEILKNNPTVYIGSGTDVEFPILLGAQNIIMVDPIFEDKEKVDEVIRRIEAMIGNNELKISEEQINSKTKTIFEFTIDGINFRIEIVPVYYALQKIIEHRRKMPSPRRYEEIKPGIEGQDLLGFMPPEKIGMILAFLPVEVSIDDDQNTIRNLVPGGYILTTGSLPNLVNIQINEPWRFNMKQLKQSIQNRYQEIGYEFIQLECEKGIDYVFLRKLQK